MIIIERDYFEVISVGTKMAKKERKAFKDNDVSGVQEYINKDGLFKYIKL